MGNSWQGQAEEFEVNVRDTAAASGVPSAARMAVDALRVYRVLVSSGDDGVSVAVRVAAAYVTAAGTAVPQYRQATAPSVSNGSPPKRWRGTFIVGLR